MLLVNDQFPGPTLEAQVGDTVRIELTNESPSESMALHFHGLSMKGQPYVDGTAGGTQCAMGPMQTQVYEFEVLDAGTHYWHGHLSMERGDGFQGCKLLFIHCCWCSFHTKCLVLFVIKFMYITHAS